MIVSIILLAAVFELCQKNERKIEVWMKASVCWSFYAFFLAEFLSFFRVLNRRGISIGWLVFDAALLAGVLAAMRRRKKKPEAGKALRQLLRIIWSRKIISITALVVLALAAVTVPYNWDSMTYHLPRIAQWAQNGSVAHYAANDIRQISSPVLAEFVNVQVYILSGEKDILLNLLQCVSYFANTWLVYEIAVKLGCRRKYASMAALLFMTMPIAFGEALNTQVDLYAAVWLLIFVYYFIELFEAKQIHFNREVNGKCMLMACCIALGYLTKPSVNIGMAFLLVLLLFQCIKRRDQAGVLLKIILCVLPVVFLPLVPEWLRNFQTLGALTDKMTGARQLAGTLRPHYLFINMLKNFAQNWPNIYLYDSREWMARLVMIAAALFRVSINDPSISEDGREYVMQPAPCYGHDTATNPVVMILAFICFLWCIMRIRKERCAGNRYSVYAMTLFFVVCAVIRWESFVTRYMLSYLALLCPMIGFGVQSITENAKNSNIRKAFVPIVYFLCLTEAISLARYHQEFWHENASVRPEGYFAHNQEIRHDYMEIIGWLKEEGYQTFGLKIGGIHYEYPVWAMLKTEDVRIENVLVENATRVYEDESYIPQCIITDGGSGEELIVVHGQEYERSEQFSEDRRLSVYIKSR